MTVHLEGQILEVLRAWKERTGQREKMVPAFLARRVFVVVTIKGCPSGECMGLAERNKRWSRVAHARSQRNIRSDSDRNELKRMA